MTDLTTRSQNGAHPAIQEHYADMSDALHHRDELERQVKELEADLAVALKLNKEYKEQLEHLTEERDYYYRKAYAFTHTLRTMKDTIESMFTLVDHEAENGTMKMPKTAHLETKE